MASGQKTWTGAYVGTGSALSITKIGWKPRYVECFNSADASVMKHFEGMPAASCAKQKAGTTSYVTSNGITLTDFGFDVGTDADLNTAGETVYFLAIW